MVRRQTWVVVVVLVALVGLSVYLQKQKSRDLAAPTATSSMIPLFNSDTGQPSLIRIQNAAGDTVEIARSADGKWVLAAPSQGEADQAASEAAATQVGALRTLSTVRLAPAVVGLDKPAYTIEVTFAQGAPHQLLVGAQTPIQDGYYAQLDSGAFQVVDKPGLDGLLALLKTPPFIATPTALATATMLMAPTAADLPPVDAGTQFTPTVAP